MPFVPGARFSIPPPPRWAFALVALAAFAFFLRVYAGIWTPEHGITKFLRVGPEFDARAIPVFRATPKFIDPYPAHRWGFDGQLYAQMALDPLLRDPQIDRALDNPAYRSQRILLSWIAWGSGLGKPTWILNVYAALNLVFWIGFAWLALRLFQPHGWRGLVGYGACLVTCGVIESMQASLTDLPSFTLVLAALMTGGTVGAGFLALAALARTTSLIGFVGIAELNPPWRDAVHKNFVSGLVACAPVAVWIGYVMWRFRHSDVGFDGGNLALPFRGVMEKLGEFSVTALHGPIRWHRWWFELYKSYELHAVLTIIAVLTQSVFLALHREWRNPLWRWGAVVVAYFWCISFLSWEEHFTITRHALPITLAFNLLLAARPSKVWLIWFLLGNCFVPFGVRHFDRMREHHAPPPPIEFAIHAPAANANSLLEVRYGDGWSAQQWWPDTTWRWARGETATVLFHNRSLQPVRAEMRFLVQSFHLRELRIALPGRTVFEGRLAAERRVITLEALTFPPGETPLTFMVSGETSKADDGTPGDVTFKVENPWITLEPP